MPRSDSRPPADPVLERIRALADPRARERSGLFFAEGIRHLTEAHDARIPIELLLVSPRLLTSALGQKLVRHQRRAGVPCHSVTPEAFRSVSVTERASGVGLVLRQPWEPLASVAVEADSTWIAVSEVAKPGNLGTILRSAEAVGADGLIALSRRVDPFDPAVLRGSMGSLYHQRFVRARLRPLRDWAKRSGLRLIGASPSAPIRFDRLACPGPVALLLGSERKGLSPEELRACDAVVRLPMRGRVDSLNVGVAAGVLLYEIYRARGFPEPSREALTTRG